MLLQEKSAPFYKPLESLENPLTYLGYQGVVIGAGAVGLLGQARFTEDLRAMVLLSLDEIPTSALVGGLQENRSKIM